MGTLKSAKLGHRGQTGLSDLLFNFATPRISGTVEARDMKFDEHIEGRGPNENDAKVSHRGLEAGSCDLVRNFGTQWYLRNGCGQKLEILHAYRDGC